ncbi:MAG: hypothetical protein LBU83_04450 [Bacteroidales bacterium]|jgi:hypothetical protein|nr:hypothetical protein [Bacteroidales bacterium]
MVENNWYEVFLENLHDKFPKKIQLTQEIMKLLSLEHEAVYRRLRKIVQFTASEIVQITTAWNISLDDILGINSGKVTFKMNPLNYLDPSEREFSNLQKRVRNLDHLQHSEKSEYMEVSNRLPRPLSISFQNLYRFRIFNWAFQYNNSCTQKEFSKIIIPENMSREFEHYKNNMVHVKNSHYIIDQKIFECYVYCVNYFHSLLLITKEEKEFIKKELYEMLDYLMEIAQKGYYPETQNRVFIYLSQLNIDTNYSFFYTDTLKTCFIHAFGKYDISCYDTEMVSSFRHWMNLKKRAAVQISEVNERKRIEFFSKQRKLVDYL